MSYVVVEVNPDVIAHWGFLQEQIRHHHHHWAHKLQNAEITEAMINFVGPYHSFIQLKIKSGHFPHHHHFTVLGEALNGMYRIINIAEGHDSIF